MNIGIGLHGLRPQVGAALDCKSQTPPYRSKQISLQGGLQFFEAKGGLHIYYLASKKFHMCLFIEYFEQPFFNTCLAPLKVMKMSLPKAKK